MAPSQFRRQMRHLIDAGYSAITTDILARALSGKLKLPAKPVLITFDDGYADFLEHAVPVLVDLKMPATLFVVSGLVGKTNAWDRRFGEPERALLDWPQLREVALAGVEIGSHSCTHPDLRSVTDQQLAEECTTSKRQLEDGLEQPCRFFAYPHGLYDARVKEAVATAGYDVAHAVLLRLRDLGRSDHLSLMRAIVHANKSFANFRLRTALASPRHRQLDVSRFAPAATH